MASRLDETSMMVIRHYRLDDHQVSSSAKINERKNSRCSRTKSSEPLSQSARSIRSVVTDVTETYNMLSENMMSTQMSGYLQKFPLCLFQWPEIAHSRSPVDHSMISEKTARWILNQDERQMIRILWVNGVKSGRQIKEAETVIQWHWWDDHGCTVGLFQWSDACSRQTDNDW